MSFIKDLLGGIGDVGKFISPLLGLTGVGIPLAAGIGGASGLLGKLNDEDQSLGSVLGGGATGAALGGLGALGGRALGGSDLTSQAAKALGPGATAEQIAEKVAAMKAAGLGGSAISGLGSLVKDNPMEVLQLGGAGLSAIQGARQQSEVNKLIEEEIERIKQQQRARLPYQNMLAESLQGGLGGDIGSIADQSQNPFYQSQPPGGSPALGGLQGATQPTRPQGPYGGLGGYQGGGRF